MNIESSHATYTPPACSRLSSPNTPNKYRYTIVDLYFALLIMFFCLLESKRPLIALPMHCQTVSISKCSLPNHQKSQLFNPTLTHSDTQSKTRTHARTHNEKHISHQLCCGQKRQIRVHGIGPSGYHQPNKSATVDALRRYFLKYFPTQDVTNGHIYLATYKSMLKCTISYSKMRHICQWDSLRRNVLRAIIPSIQVRHAGVVEGIVHRLCVRRRYKEVCPYCRDATAGYFWMRAAELEAVIVAIKRFFDGGMHFKYRGGCDGAWRMRCGNQNVWQMRAGSRVELLRICCNLLEGMGMFEE